MSGHTKEPWNISHRNERGVEIQGVDGDGVCLSHDDGGKADIADARRIVACVNACTGISNDVLEAGAIIETDKLYAADKALDAAIRQRDELLDTLKHLNRVGGLGHEIHSYISMKIAMVEGAP